MIMKFNTIVDWLLQLKKWLLSNGFSEMGTNIFYRLILAVIILLVAWVVYIFIRQALRRIIPYYIRKSKTSWDDILLKNRVFSAFALFAPAIIIYFTAYWFESEIVTSIIKKIVIIYCVVIFLKFVSSFLNSINEIYMLNQKEYKTSLKIYIQILNVIFYSLGIFFAISLLFDISLNNIWKMMISFGAFATILLVVFKDTILGLVAGITLSTNKMVNIGDWVTIHKHNTDGIVIDITLTTIKIQNWDQTISNVPTYTLVSDSFINWRGMKESGGRQIKRHFNIDINSIHFLNDEDIKNFSRIELIKEYIHDIKKKIDKVNINKLLPADQWRMTNIGTFRKYVENFLRNHPGISKQHTFIVRQLQPTAEGIPLEIYAFSKDQDLVNYGNVQSDIFDHIFAIAKEFKIKIFQNPSGSDFRELAKNAEK